MNRLPICRQFLSLGLIMALSSCGTMETLKTGASTSVSKVSGGFGKVTGGLGKVSSGVAGGFGKMSQGVGDLAKNTKAKVLPSRLPVVEAREEDLKEVPQGHEQALAYQKKRRRGFWIFGGPVDFEEPELPEIGEPSSAGLLPPKAD